MEIAELKNDIKSNKLKPFYIFTGEEWKVQEIYLNQMEKVVGKKVYCDTVSDVLFLLNRKLFSSGERAVYVVRDDPEFISKEKVQSAVLDSLSDNVLVLLLSSVDKRTKLYRTYRTTLVEFSSLERAVLRRYVARDISLSNRNVDRLMDICEGNYGRCLLEIDKIRRVGKVTFTEVDNDNNYDADKTFQMLVDNGVIYQPPYDAIFDFVDMVMKRKVNASFDLLNQCYAVGESSLVMLSVLYSNTKQVLQVQSYKGDNLAKATGLTAWQIKKAKEKIGYRSVGELVYMLKLIRNIEKGIKTGQMEEEYAIPYLLTCVL